MPDPTGRISHLPEMHRGVAWKEPCRVATTANITISTALNNGDTIDGITLATGDRVLVKDQSTGSQNGIYVVGASPARAYDMDQDSTTSVPASEVLGALIYVIAGTTNGGKLFKNTNTSAPTLGSTALTFSAVSSGVDLSGVDFLVGTATGLLSSEIVAGTTPGGELGGTWASPTVDATHAGSTHIALSSATPLVESGAGSAGTGTAASKDDHVHPAAGGSGTLSTVEEVDGSPTDSAVTKLVFPNGTLSITSHVATYTPAGGGGGGGTAVVLGLPTGSLSRSYTFDSTVESWTASAGSITASGAKAVLTHTSNTVGLEPSGASNVADGEVQAEFVIAGGVEASLVFRATDASNFYMFTLTDLGQTSALYKCVAGTFTALLSTTGTWFWGSGVRGAMLRMMVRFNGSDIQCYLNGTLVFVAKDTTYTTGRVGARTFNGTLNIDNVKVYSSPDLYTGNVSTP